MRQICLAGVALSLLALAEPASAMPLGKIALGVVNEGAGVTPVHYRRYYRSRAYYYRPRVHYGYRSYDYDDGYPVVRSYGYGGGPYYGGYGNGYYGGGPSIGFSFGGGRW